ncbi:MAG: VCBS repeat-containing protein [Cyclobacteriaceae bacterium]
MQYNTLFVQSLLAIFILIGFGFAASNYSDFLLKRKKTFQSADSLRNRNDKTVDNTSPLKFAREKDLTNGEIQGISALDLADVDGDGLVDVGVFDGGKHAEGRITFAWLQSPDDPASGSWKRHDLPLPTPFLPFIGAAKFGDVDHDGDSDLVVSMDNHSGPSMSAYLFWLENQAQARQWVLHTIARDLPVHHINDMSLADMDGDGLLDVVVRALTPNQLMFYFQDESDVWFEKTIDTSPYKANGEGFAIGDIDRYGQLDISIAGHWLEAPNNPRQQDYTDHGIDIGYKEVNQNVKEDIGDINGDGRNDVIISPAEGYRAGGNHELAWYAAPADPTTTDVWKKHVLATNYNGGHTVRLADIDHDGDLDIISGLAWNQWEQTQCINIWYFNRTSGTYGDPQTVLTGKGLYSGTVGDIGNDGDLDIVGQNGYSGTSKPYFYENLLQ